MPDFSTIKPEDDYTPEHWLGPEETRMLEKYLRGSIHALANRVQKAVSEFHKDYSAELAEVREEMNRVVNDRLSAMETRQTKRLDELVQSITGGTSLESVGYKGVVLEVRGRIDRVEGSLGAAWKFLIGIVLLILGAAAKEIMSWVARRTP